MTLYTCVSDRYDNDSTNVYINVEDFDLMCQAVFGERPDLRQIGEEWHDAEGCVLVPFSTVAIRRPGNTAWAEGVPFDDAETEREIANRVAPGHQIYPERN